MRYLMDSDSPTAESSTDSSGVLLDESFGEVEKQ